MTQLAGTIDAGINAALGVQLERLDKSNSEARFGSFVFISFEDLDDVDLYHNQIIVRVIFGCLLFDSKQKTMRSQKCNARASKNRS